jgi:endonuclease G
MISTGTDIVEASRARLRRTGIDLERLGKAQVDGPRAVSRQQQAQRLRNLMERSPDAVMARTALERVLGGNDLVGINYLSIGVRRARAVCRIHLRSESGSTVGYGTGFLIGPGVLMTNHHVISTVEEARSALAEFDYEYDALGHDRPVATFRILGDPAPIVSKDLDFCLAAVAPDDVDGRRALSEFGWLTLNPTPGKSIVGEYLTIIQHPGGERKQVCVRENRLLRYDDNGSTLWYQTDTVGGSSGSPVFNHMWDVVALHHSGVPESDADGRWLSVDGKPWSPSMGEDRVKWIANEGIRISSIMEYIRTRRAGEPLAEPIVHPAPPASEASEMDRDALPRPTLAGDELSITIPVRIAVRLGADLLGGGRLAAAASGTAPAVPVARPSAVGSVAPPGGIESVSVDQSDYGARTGYRPDFLGDGDLMVPLPRITRAASRKDIVPVKGSAGGELRYWNYSVVMNGSRRLAFFSAVNVDADRRPKGAGRDGDRWFTDSRIPDEQQLGKDFYGQQKEFEVDRGQNPFDRATRTSSAGCGPSTRSCRSSGTGMAGRSRTGER